ncbi:hypothetical protein DPM19_30565 [Actinomadura craniellae]|uniref:Copper chaperone PCu(A)C n=2 Tax=Actinomadura craniellae TaxID=2231787 RepID=A0A365GX21_9ACTN|nr:hypothetical protein DPM19_30565 [Actinomadura craniellae]
MVVLAVAGAVAMAPVISGCGAGDTPQSAMPDRLTEGVNVTLPQGKMPAQMAVRNLFVLGPRPGETFTAGASLPVYASLINQVAGRPDRLVSVSSPAFSGFRISDGSVALPPATRVELTGGTEAGAAPTPTEQGASRTPVAQRAPRTSAASPRTNVPDASGSPSPGATSPSPSPGAAGAVAPAPPAAAAGGPQVVLTGLSGELRGGDSIELTLRFEKSGSTKVLVPVVPWQKEYTTYSPVPGVSASAAPSPSTPAPGHGTEAGHGAAPSDPGATPSGPASPGAGAPPADGGH